MILIQGSYRQVCVKFKDFSRTSKRFSTVFKDLKLMKILIEVLNFFFSNGKLV